MLAVSIHNDLPQGTCHSDLSASIQLTGRHSDPACRWMATEKKKLIHPLPMLAKPRDIFAWLMAFLFYFLISSPSLFYKWNWHPDPDKMVLGDTSQSSRSAGFPNKVTIPCLSILSPNLLACPAASKASLYSVTNRQNYRSHSFTLKTYKSGIIRITHKFTSNSWNKLNVLA